MYPEMSQLSLHPGRHSSPEERQGVAKLREKFLEEQGLAAHTGQGDVRRREVWCPRSDEGAARRRA